LWEITSGNNKENKGDFYEKKTRPGANEEASGPRCLRRIVVEPTDHVVI
jgi:hypothetical protein